MIAYILGHTLLAALCCCVMPTLVFSALNATRFTLRQVINALLFSSFLGLIVWLALQHVPVVIGAIILSLTSCLISEGLISDLCKKERNSYIFVAIFTLINMALAWQWGYIPFNILFLTYGILELKVLYKRLQLPKESIFSAKNFTKITDKDTYTSPLVLPEKTNIYFLFWESMHSREAIKELYDFDDAELYNYFDEKKFTVYENTFSNASYTIASWNTMINMNYMWDNAEGIPTLIQILRANDYDLLFYEQMPYTFAPMVKYSNYYNLDIPPYVKFLYDLMFPFFLQSKIFMNITKNINPFAKHISSSTLIQSFSEQLAKPKTKPQCHFISLGAGHSGSTYTYKEKDIFSNTYKNTLYPRASRELREISDLILKHDPNAIIAVTGDHGARLLVNTWEGESSDLNQNIIKNGYSPETVGLDISSVLIAIRWPKNEPQVKTAISPCNMFRYMFKSMGGKGKMLNPVQNYAFIHTQKHYRVIVAYEGQKLNKWQIVSPQQYLQFTIMDVENRASTPQEWHTYISFMKGITLIKNCIDKSLQAIKLYPDDLSLYLQLIDMLISSGNAQRAYTFSKKMITKYPQNRQVRTYLILSLALLGKHELSLSMIDSMAEYIDSPDSLRRDIYLMSNKPALALEAAKKAYENSPQSSADGADVKLHNALIYYVFLLYHSGKKQEAIEAVAKAKQLISPKVAWQTSYWATAAFLSIHCYDWEYTEKQALKLIDMELNQCYNYMHLLRLGAMEQQGKIDEAIAFFHEKRAIFDKLVGIAATMGLFAIRNKVVNDDFREMRKLGYQKLKYFKGFFTSNVGLFDAEWYKEEYKNLLKGEDPLFHYIHYHNILLTSPNPHIDSLFYYSIRPGLAEFGADPVLHFLDRGSQTNSDPSLFFNVKAYISQNPELLYSKTNAVMHYLQKQNQALD